MCIDRCVAKYLEIHERIGELLHVRIFSIMLSHLGKKLTEISMADQQFQQTLAGGGGAQ